MQNLELHYQQYLAAIASIFRQKQIKAKIQKFHRGMRNLEFLLRLNNPLDLKDLLSLSEEIALTANTEGILAQRKMGLVSLQFAISKNLWKEVTRSDLQNLEIALTDESTPIEMDLDSHYLLAGQTRSGKSFNAFTCVLQAIQTFTPEELQVVCIDPHAQWQTFTNNKTKESFTTFKASSHFKQFDWGCTAQDSDSIEKALQWVVDEMDSRLANNYSEPRLLVVLDEADSVSSMSESINHSLTRISKESLKTSINLIALSQEPTKANLSYRDLLDTRIFGKSRLRTQEIKPLLGQSVNLNSLTMQGDSVITSDLTSLTRVLFPRLGKSDFERIERGNQVLTEVQPPKNHIPDLSENLGGRPIRGIDPQLLAHLWYYGPHGIGINKLCETFNTGVDRVKDHQQLIKDFAREYLKLRNLKELD